MQSLLRLVFYLAALQPTNTIACGEIFGEIAARLHNCEKCAVLSLPNAELVKVGGLQKNGA
jgi:hypothetical protein